MPTGNGYSALSDAKACIILRPDWPEAYYRAGTALSLLKKFNTAADTFLMGLKLDPGIKELQDAFQTSAVNESIELKHEVEALKGQLAAANTYAERCKTSTLQAKEAYLAIRAEVEELERKMDDLQEERECRTSGEARANPPQAAAPRSRDRVTLPRLVR
ncbi:hypothetical protein IFM89_005115 [Coptis chinensis]|uniref:Uncharacterized protein n=1 Tax=Coptis chinensis TaxID=261450 RepID=A0A835IJU4_9MAGN|nr:hypothetical protein IFM89_005115 [Coptis chinensis]